MGVVCFQETPTIPFDEDGDVEIINETKIRKDEKPKEKKKKKKKDKKKEKDESSECNNWRAGELASWWGRGNWRGGGEGGTGITRWQGSEKWDRGKRDREMVGMGEMGQGDGWLARTGVAGNGIARWWGRGKWDSEMVGQREIGQ